MKAINKIISKLLLISLVVFSSCNKDETKPAEQVTTPNYTNFKILTLKITAMPFLDLNSAGWDPFDGPDVYFNITDGSNILMNGSSSKMSDVLSSNLPLTWNFSVAHQITNITMTQFIEIWDYDTLDPNDFIGSVGFKLEDYKSGYPTSITKSNGGITVTITGNWY